VIPRSLLPAFGELFSQWVYFFLCLAAHKICLPLYTNLDALYPFYSWPSTIFFTAVIDACAARRLAPGLCRLLEGPQPLFMLNLQLRAVDNSGARTPAKDSAM
jgi:hypothetical protein